MMRTTKTIGVLFILLIVPNAVLSAPSITGVSGTAANGQTLNVSGTQFGAIGPRVVLFDDFERGTAGEYLNNHFNAPEVGVWHGAGNFPAYNSAFKRSGSLSMRTSNYMPNDFGGCPNPGGGCDTDNYQSFFHDFQDSLGGEANEVYAEYSVFVPSNCLYPLETGYRVNFKGDWLYGYHGDHSDTTNDWRLFHSGNNAPNRTDGPLGSLDAGPGTNTGTELTDSCGLSMYPNQIIEVPPINRWVRNMVYAKGSTTCNGELAAWQAPFINYSAAGLSCDSTSPSGSGSNLIQRNTCQLLRKQRTGFNTLQVTHPEGWGRFALNGYATNNDGHPVSPGNYFWYYDDVYIATGPGARARVVLANYPKWGDPAHGTTLDMTICTPNSWSDTSVSCTVRQGAFTSGQAAYLFVVDANGNVSDQDLSTPGAQGRPITIGSGGPTDTTSPAKPTNLRVQ